MKTVDLYFKKIFVVCSIILLICSNLSLKAQVSGSVIVHNNLSNYFCLDGTITFSVNNPNLNANDSIAYACSWVLYRNNLSQWVDRSGFTRYASGTLSNYPSYTTTNLDTGTYYIHVHNYGNYNDSIVLGAILITEPPCNITLMVDSVYGVTGLGYNCNDGFISFTANSTTCLNYYTAYLFKNGSLYANSGGIPFGGSGQFSNLPPNNFYQVKAEVFNGYCADQGIVYSFQELPCDMTISVDTVINVSSTGAQDGQINITGNSTSCSSYVAYLYKNGTFISGTSNISFGSSYQFTGLDTGNYYVKVVNVVLPADSCVDSTTNIQITQPQTTSIKAIDHSQNIVFPNPFNSSTTIKFKSIIINGQLDIYNSHGQRVQAIKNISGQTITPQRGSFANGIYLISLTQDDKVIWTNKLLITD